MNTKSHKYWNNYTKEQLKFLCDDKDLLLQTTGTKIDIVNIIVQHDKTNKHDSRNIVTLISGFEYRVCCVDNDDHMYYSNDMISLKKDCDLCGCTMFLKQNPFYKTKFNTIQKTIVSDNKQRKQIPSKMRYIVWNKYMSPYMIGLCMCCSITTIDHENWDCGHVVSEKNNGKNTIDNLRPICRSCNLSMRTENMLEFMNRCGFVKPKNWDGSVHSNNSDIICKHIELLNVKNCHNSEKNNITKNKLSSESSEDSFIDNDTESSSSVSSSEEIVKKSNNKKIPKKEVSDITKNSQSPVLNMATKSNIRLSKQKAISNINRMTKFI